MPRRYRMSARAAAVEQTRQRIIAASMDLHAEQGILGTSYEEVAERADTSPATVYRHFPSLDELLPACAPSIQVLRPLAPGQADELFSDLKRPTLRMEVLVRGTCDCYARDHGWLNAARREEDLVPALGDIATTQRENLRLLTEAALAGHDVSARTLRAIVALIDFPFWKLLRDAGASDAEAADQILELVRDQLAKEDVF